MSYILQYSTLKNSLFLNQYIIVHSSMHATKWNEYQQLTLKESRKTLQNSRWPRTHEAISWSAETHVGNNISSVGISIRYIPRSARYEINGQDSSVISPNDKNSDSICGSKDVRRRWEGKNREKTLEVNNSMSRPWPSTTWSRSKLPQPYAERNHHLPWRILTYHPPLTWAQ